MRIGWFETGGGMLRYAHRPGAGPALVLIHEMGGSIESWDLVLQSLSHDREIVLAEMRGMGFSERVHAPFTFADLAADVVALLDHLKIERKAILSGCAVGGAVALKICLDHPHRSAGCLALDPALDVAAERRDATFALAERMRLGGMRVVEGDLLERTYPELYRQRAPEHFAVVRARWLANDPASFSDYLKVLCRTDMIPELRRIDMPVWLSAGVNDVLRPPDYVRHVAAEIPGSRVVELDAGHHVPDHAPREVSGLLTGLVSQVS